MFLFFSILLWVTHVFNFSYGKGILAMQPVGMQDIVEIMHEQSWAQRTTFALLALRFSTPAIRMFRLLEGILPLV